MRLEKRSTFGWGTSGASAARPTQGLVIHYNGANQGLAGKSHSACQTYWKNTRRFHMGASRGWADIGYSFGACPHGIVLEGRGLGRTQAAQPGGNSTWYSVTLMGGPGEDPTPEQINAVRQLRAYLMSQGVGGAVRGHRDFISTSCPGDRAYKLVRDGVFARPAGQEEDDMEPTTTVDIPPYWEGKEFSHGSYSAAFLWAGSLSETRAYGKAILARLDAQAATIEELARAVAAQGEIDAGELIERISKRLEEVTVRLDVAEEEPPKEG
jgi:hypothetical protein